MGRDRLLSDSRKEGRHYRHDDFDLERFIHLHSLPLPKDRSSQVWSRYGSHGRFLIPLLALCLVDANRPQEAEQESCSNGRYYHLPLLGVVSGRVNEREHWFLEKYNKVVRNRFVGRH